jgi:hypothetical protein
LSEHAGTPAEFSAATITLSLPDDGRYIRADTPLRKEAPSSARPSASGGVSIRSWNWCDPA